VWFGLFVSADLLVYGFELVTFLFADAPETFQFPFFLCVLCLVRAPRFEPLICRRSWCVRVHQPICVDADQSTHVELCQSHISESV